MEDRDTMMVLDPRSSILDPRSLLFRRNNQLLPWLNFVRVRELIAVGVKDAHVFVRAAVKLLADFRERVAGFDGICLTARLDASYGRGPLLRRFNSDVGREVTVVWVDQLDLIPDRVLGLLGRGRASDEQFVVFDVQVLQPHVLLLDRVEHRLIFLLELVELLLGSRSGAVRSAPEHLVKDSHNIPPRFFRLNEYKPAVSAGLSN